MGRLFGRGAVIATLSALRRGLLAGMVGALAVAGLAAPARADIVWNFSFAGNFPTNYGPHIGQTDIITGQLTTSALNPGGNTYTILGITGIDNGSAITGLVNEPYTDNLLYVGTPYLDFDGFSFNDAAGENLNLYYNVAYGHYFDWFNHGQTIVTNGTFTISRMSPTGVPEPASLALFGMALVGLALRRRHA